jgi:CheY-like chemotaxis protein
LSSAFGTITRHGGSTHVESALGRGATFTVELPISDSALEITAQPAPLPTATSLRILLVEDDDRIASILRRILSRSHVVDVAADGAEALTKFVSGNYHVALIDLNIPKVPGHEVARQIRQRDPSVVTVLITGWVLPPEDERLTHFDLYLQKPILATALSGAMAQASALYDSRN